MQPEKFAAEIASMVKSYVQDALYPVLQHVQALENKINSLPAPQNGEPGRDGEDGKDGAPGKDGVDGRDGDPGANGKDGVDGKDGKDGKDALAIDILPSINEEKSYPKGTFASHRGGIWLARQATDGMNGWDLIVDGAHKITTQVLGEREFALITEKSSGKVTKTPFTVPMMIYRSIFKAGNKYQKGDAVTWGGSLWHCDEPNENKPGEGEGWQLVAKRGRDGRKDDSK